MKIIAIIFFISLAFVSCDAIKKEDLQGDWIGIPAYDPATDFAKLQFDSERLKVLTPDGLVKTYTYGINQNRLELIVSDQSFKIQKVHRDTLYFNNATYARADSIYFPDEYKLIGIKTEMPLKESTTEYKTLHAYRDSNDIFRIRNDDKYLLPENIKFAVSSSRSHTPPPDTVIFLGENLELLDLKMIYYELMDMNIRRVYLVLNQTFPNEYDIFEDYIEIWWEDMNNRHLKNNSQSLPKEYYPVKNDLYDHDILVTTIRKNENLKKLNNLDQNKTHLIVIDSDMTINDYIGLKMIVAKLRKEKYQIATEITH